MRIVSLLPGATETLFALGLGGSVVGVTHECDHPAEARRLPRVTRSNLELEGLGGGAIEDRVAGAAAAVTWGAVRQARPRVLLLAPCGFDEARARREAEACRPAIEAVGSERVAIFDGSAYFNRPGPRLVDSLELLVGVAAGYNPSG